MASLYPPERDIPPSPSDVVSSSTGVEAFDKAESEINSHFVWLHQKLDVRKKAILDKLREKRAEFEELEAARVGQLEEIESLKQSLLKVGIKYNKSNVLRKENAGFYDDTIEELKIPIQSKKIVFENFADKFDELISSMDLTFVDSDCTAIVDPIFSIDRDSILLSLNAIKSEKLVQPEENDILEVTEKHVVVEKKEIESVNLSQLAFDSETNRIFALNIKCNNILVFQQDGTVIACIEEGCEDLTDICVDANNRFLYVLDEDNCIYKFDITTYQLIDKKENENKEIKDDLSCLDVHNGDIYVGTESQGVHVFSSEFEHIRTIPTNTFGCLDIICRDEGMFICSLIPPQLSVFSYNGDLIRNGPLYFISLIKGLFLRRVLPFHTQFSIYKNNCTLFDNSIDNCIEIHTFGGHLVHKIAFPSEGDSDALISGLVSTNDGRIFVSFYNSKYPLRCY